LLAVQRHERDFQVMRRGDVHGVGAAEPDVGGQLCSQAPQPAVEGHKAQFAYPQQHLNSLMRKFGVPRSSRDGSGNLGK
jgi:hypothetical protein